VLASATAARIGRPESLMVASASDSARIIPPRFECKTLPGDGYVRVKGRGQVTHPRTLRPGSLQNRALFALFLDQ
jgi:hypothetical protein